MTKERIEKLLKVGANVILTTKGIDDMALKVNADIWFSNFFTSIPSGIELAGMIISILSHAPTLSNWLHVLIIESFLLA